MRFRNLEAAGAECDDEDGPLHGCGLVDHPKKKGMGILRLLFGPVRPSVGDRSISGFKAMEVERGFAVWVVANLYRSVEQH